MIASKTEPRESKMVGLHGSLTQAEQLVPLLTPLRHAEPDCLPDVCPQAAAGTAPPLAWLSTESRRLSTVSSQPPSDAGEPPGPVIGPAELAELLASADRPVVLDVRWRLGGPPGIDSYLAGHLPKACFIDLDKDLSGRPGQAGRHPLPEPRVVQAAMRTAGLRSGQLAVAYDDGDSTVAARLWWVLRYYGHEQVAVLDGGYRAWATVGTAAHQGGQPAGAAGDFTITATGQMPMLDDAEAAALARSGFLLDARAGERYRGEVEPVDRVGGHIPGAISAPTKEQRHRRRQVPRPRRPSPPVRRPGPAGS